jgi:hypothetical protein
VKQPVAGGWHLARGNFPLHLRDGLAQARDLRFLHSLRRQCRQLALDQLPCANRLQRTFSLVQFLQARRIAQRGVDLTHVDPRAHAHLDASLDLERDEGLAHRRSGHAELGREVALRRQS